MGSSFILSYFTKDNIDRLCRDYGEITIEINFKKGNQELFGSTTKIKSFNELLNYDDRNMKAYYDMAKRQNPREKKLLT